MSTSITPLIGNLRLAQSQDRILLRLPFILTAGTGVNTARYCEIEQPGFLIEGGTGAALTAITQASVNELLGNVGDVNVAATFGTTAMVDNNTYGFVVACSGIFRSLPFCEVNLEIAGVVTTQLSVPTKTPLTNVSFTGTQIFLTPAGNIAGRVQLTNISAAATVGYIFIKLSAELK